MGSVTVFLGIGGLVPCFGGDLGRIYAALLVARGIESRGRARMAGVGYFVTGIG